MFLLRLSPDSGPVPDMSDLAGIPFADRYDLRAAIKARMREIDPTPVSGADRVRAHAERQQERGLKQVREWIPAEREPEFREIARQMRDQAAKNGR
jgi:5-formyltetrahydrofolate cyclo-ligase